MSLAACSKELEPNRDLFPHEIVEVAADNLPEKYEITGVQNRTNVLLNNLLEIYNDSCLGLNKIERGINPDNKDFDNAGSIELEIRDAEDLSCVHRVSDEVNQFMAERAYNCSIGSTSFTAGEEARVEIEFECFGKDLSVAGSF